MSNHWHVITVEELSSRGLFLTLMLVDENYNFSCIRYCEGSVMRPDGSLDHSTSYNIFAYEQIFVLTEVKLYQACSVPKWVTNWEN